MSGRGPNPPVPGGVTGFEPQPAASIVTTGSGSTRLEPAHCAKYSGSQAGSLLLSLAPSPPWLGRIGAGATHSSPSIEVGGPEP
jgi:hypothetical protein